MDVGLLAVMATFAMTAAGQKADREDIHKPLLLKEQGSFFVGGETKTLCINNSFT